MFLALREIRRSLLRFAMLTVAVALVVFLVLFQQALQTGLVTAFVGATRNQSAPVIVYNIEGQRTLQGSVIGPDAEAAIDTLAEVGAATRLAERTFTVIDAQGRDDTAAIVGVGDATVSHARTLTAGRHPSAPGEAVGSDVDFEIGDVITVPAQSASAVEGAGGGSGTPNGDVTLTVVGTARDIQLSVSPTLFTDFNTYAAAVRAINPDATTVLPGAIALHPAEGVTNAELIRAVNALDPDLDAMTREVAARTAPGVAQVRQSFSVVLALFTLVIPLVTGLFFLIITLQKSRAFTLLRAIGAPVGMLARALLVQVLAVTVAGLLLGTAGYWMLMRGKVGSLSVRYDSAAVNRWTVIFLVLAVLGSLVSLRRVARIEPYEAVAGGGRR